MSDNTNVKEDTFSMGFPTANRIGEYLKPYIDEYVFDRLSEAYLERSGASDTLSDVPVPIKQSELTELTNLKIAHSMAMVVGCDIDFPYAPNYIEYIRKTFGKDFVPPLLNEGVELAASGKPEEACIPFRAVLLLDPGNVDALYCYGRALKDAYEEGEDEAYVGLFKAESLEAFEKLTILAPEFSMGYYFLGYAYLNLGLYIKALLTFKDFVRLEEETDWDSAEVADDVRMQHKSLLSEVDDWIEKLEDPVKIETAYNNVLAGRFEEGLSELIPYTEDPRFKDWWPLYFYIGTAYKEMGEAENAIASFKKVLAFSPSDIMTMQELVDIYEAIGDSDMARKYSEKILLIERNREEEKAERNGDFS